MEAQKQMLAHLIRHGLTVVAAFLVAKGLITPDFAEAWVGETTLYIAAAVVASIPILWGYLKQRFDRKVVEAAVQLPPPAADTKAEIKFAVEEAKAIAAADSSVVTNIPY